MWQLALALALAGSCRTVVDAGGRAATGVTLAGGVRAHREAEARRRCYPYLPRADASCPTACEHRDQCQGSRGPADFAENGWPLDCINSRCVPLPPGHVTGRRR